MGLLAIHHLLHLCYQIHEGAVKPETVTPLITPEWLYKCIHKAFDATVTISGASVTALGAHNSNCELTRSHSLQHMLLCSTTDMTNLSSVLPICLIARVLRARYAMWTYTLEGLVRTVVMAGGSLYEQLLPEASPGIACQIRLQIMSSFQT